MITLAAVAVYAGLMMWLIVRRRFLFYLLTLTLVPISVRLASVVYVDLLGPVYSDQLFRDVGPGSAAPPLVLAFVFYLVPFLIAFRLRRATQLARRAREAADEGPTTADATVATAVFIAFAIFVILLFADLVRIGVVPFFAGIERYEYTTQYGGIWHAALMKYGALLAFFLGLFYSIGVLLRGRPDERFLFLLISLFVYLFLAGHRFSAFFTHSAAFLIPYGAVTLVGQRGESRRADPSSRFVRARSLILVATVCLGGTALVGAAVYNSYFNTRDTGEGSPLEALAHRTLVQPGELWYATWERAFISRSNRPAEAFDRVFVHPVTDPGLNSSIPYLMIAEVGDRAYPTLEQGSAYGGGFPEIFFELCGPLLAYPVLFVTGSLTAWLWLVLVRAILERRYVRVALCWYVLFALVLISLGGMLNFLVNWKFWAKVAALAGWVLFERERERLVRAPPEEVRA